MPPHRSMLAGVVGQKPGRPQFVGIAKFLFRHARDTSRALARHEKIPALAALGRACGFGQFGIQRSAGSVSLIEDLVAAGDAAVALLLLLAGLGSIMLLGEQFKAHRLRAFIFNFEVARHRSSADL
jgi:hypothetical protein